MGQDDWAIVFNALQEAKVEGLETEVVVFALQYLKDNPKGTIRQAIQHGLDEWIK